MFKEWIESIPGCLQGGENKVATLSCIPGIFLNVLGALLMFAGLTALVIFIVGSLKYMDSEGDPKKLESAKHTFEFGITGLAIIIFSFAIVSIISIVTHTPCIARFGFACPQASSAPTQAPTPQPSPSLTCESYKTCEECVKITSDHPPCLWRESEIGAKACVPFQPDPESSVCNDLWQVVNTVDCSTNICIAH